MRLKIRTKVFLIGALITIALMTLAFVLSVVIYKNNARDKLLADVNASVEDIDKFFIDEAQQEELEFIRDYLLKIYTKKNIEK